MVRGRIGSEIEIELPCDYEHLFCLLPLLLMIRLDGAQHICVHLCYCLSSLKDASAIAF